MMLKIIVIQIYLLSSLIIIIHSKIISLIILSTFIFIFLFGYVNAMSKQRGSSIIIEFITQRVYRISSNEIRQFGAWPSYQNTQRASIVLSHSQPPSLRFHPPTTTTFITLYISVYVSFSIIDLVSLLCRLIDTGASHYRFIIKK